MQLPEWYHLVAALVLVAEVMLPGCGTGRVLTSLGLWLITAGLTCCLLYVFLGLSTQIAGEGLLAAGFLMLAARSSIRLRQRWRQSRRLRKLRSSLSA